MKISELDIVFYMPANGREKQLSQGLALKGGGLWKS